MWQICDTNGLCKASHGQDFSLSQFAAERVAVDAQQVCGFQLVAVGCSERRSLH